MITDLKPQDLIDFEDEVIRRFENKEILAPIHLYSNCEEQMMKVFEEVKEQDWVLCTWRSHYQALLKGIPREKVMDEIVKGHSISLNFPEYRFFSSAIVTGTLPIAVGLGLEIKRRGGDEKVWVFVGDMAAETGSMHECYKYVVNHDLPVVFVVEDNGISVCSDTQKVWGREDVSYWFNFGYQKHPHIRYYKYKSKYPHSGGNKRIQF